MRRHARIFWRGTLSCARTRRAGVRRARGTLFVHYDDRGNRVASFRRIRRRPRAPRHIVSSNSGLRYGARSTRRGACQNDPRRVAPTARAFASRGRRSMASCLFALGGSRDAREGKRSEDVADPARSAPVSEASDSASEEGEASSPPRRRGRTRGVRTRFASRPSPSSPRSPTPRVASARRCFLRVGRLPSPPPPPPSTSTLRRP